MATYGIGASMSKLEFDTQNCKDPVVISIDSTHFLAVWGGRASDYGQAQVFSINTPTLAITTAGAVFQFDTQTSILNSIKKIDTNHFVLFSTGADSDGFVRVLTVNTTTWAVTTASSYLEFDTQMGYYNSCAKIDTNHFINFWNNISVEGRCQVFTVNTTTWAVTTAGATFSAGSTNYNSCLQIDSNHFINFWQDNNTGDGFVQVFAVNTTTWAVTTAGSSLEFDTQDNDYNAVIQIDSTHFLNCWSGLGDDGYCQIFAVNTTTWAVTTAGQPLEFDTELAVFLSPLKIDTNHFVLSWQGSAGNDGFLQTFKINTTTWAITTSATALEFDTQDKGAGSVESILVIDNNHFLQVWQGVDGDGFCQSYFINYPLPTFTDSIGASDNKNMSLNSTKTETLSITDVQESDARIVWVNEEKNSATWVNEDK